MVHQKSVICAVVSAVLVLIVAPIGQINGSPSGAPLSACTTMTPDPIAHGAPPQTNSIPFTTELPDGYFAVMGNSVRLELRPKNAETSFKGFLVRAFKAGTTESVGTFSLVSNGKTLDCPGGTQNAATHKDRDLKKLVSLTWTPPADLMGDVVFKTTYVLEKSIFWVQNDSKTLTIGHTVPDSSTVAPVTTTKPVVTTPSGSSAPSACAALTVISLASYLMRS